MPWSLHAQVLQTNVPVLVVPVFLYLDNPVLSEADPAEGVPAEFRICSLLHVSSVEPLSPSATGSNT